MSARCFAQVVFALFVLTAAGPGLAAPAEAPALPDMDKAVWIWNTKDAAGKGKTPPAEHVWFRKTFELAEEPLAAMVLVTADNGYELSVNSTNLGSDVGFESAHWQSVEKYDIANVLVKGKNVIAIHGIDLGGGTAGLIAAVRIETRSGKPVEFTTDATWRISLKTASDWEKPEFDDAAWPNAAELGANGIRPWGKVRFGAVAKPAAAVAAVGKGRPAAVSPKELFVEPPADFGWPEAVIFIADDCSLGSNGRTLFRIGNSRAYTQNDIPGPSLIGRTLCMLRPAKPDGEAGTLLDAGNGVIGSPSVSFDGKWIYFSYLKEGANFYHVYRIAAAGGEPQRLTDGPFHDYDPVELPDGRIVFSSTRMGTFEEYHSAPARGLFAIPAPDASGQAALPKPLTNSIVFDQDPRVTADGRIAFVRADNFGDRGKVETHIQVARPDGTCGFVAIGPDRRPISYNRGSAGGDIDATLRSYGFGSPAPLPDGRIACLSTRGALLAEVDRPGPKKIGNLGVRELCDLSPLPDNRLLCTTATMGEFAVVDPDTAQMVVLHRPKSRSHSVTYLGSRPRPPVVGSVQSTRTDATVTGVLFCQSVFNSRHSRLDWQRIKAVRVYEGRGLKQRSSHSEIVHIGTEGVECGTVPVAPDGSFSVEIPADRAVAMQAVDAEGRHLLNEMSWQYVRPGEVRSCVGCHSPWQSTPTSKLPALASRWRPVRIAGEGAPHRFRCNNAADGGAMNLQWDRFREVASIDLYQLDEVKGPGRQAEVQRLLKDLGEGDWATRASAAQRLAIHRDRSATPGLCAALGDQVREVRMHVAMALSASGDGRALPGLAEALADKEPIVAQAAHVALENLTGHTVSFRPGEPAGQRGEGEWKAFLKANPPSALEQAAIAALADKDSLVLHRAAVAIGHIGGPAGAEALAAALAAGKFREDLRASLEAIRALGHLPDPRSVDLLIGLLLVNQKTDGGTLQRANAAAESLGRLGLLPEARAKVEAALLQSYESLGDFWTYCGRYGDHSALHACHASPGHHRIAEALDAMGSTAAGRIVPLLLRAVPIDTDRGILMENDAVERITARVIARSGRAAQVIEACLAVLGDQKATDSPELRPAITASGQAWGGRFDPPTRAAQLLSVVCCDPQYGPRILETLKRYAKEPPQAISRGLGNPSALPKNHWISFFLGRLLGKLRYQPAVEMLADAVASGQPEAALGRPAAPAVHLLYIHNTQSPFWRAAAADALGRIGDRRASAALLAAVKNMDNASDVRVAAAGALRRLADRSILPELRKLAEEHPEVATQRLLREACIAAGKTP